MPGPIHRRENLANQSRRWLAAVLLHGNDRNDQKLFNHAMELIRRRNKTTNQEIVARATLRSLAQAGRTWTNRPSSNRFTGNNYESNANLNSNNNSPPPRHPAPPRESQAVRFYRAHMSPANFAAFERRAAQPSVRKFAERWRLKGPVKLVNLPANKNNRTDPVSLHTFRAGQEAIQHQRRNTEGRIISTRYYLLPTIERLAGVNWKTIRRMHPNKVLLKEAGKGNKFLATKHVPNVITRLPMYRKHLTLVKFKA
jgi:hypothetical protein